MHDYPAFSGDTPTCVKCGYEGATAKYMQIGTCDHVTDTVMGFHRNQRLHRECRRYDYAWDEAIVEATHE